MPISSNTMYPILLEKGKKIGRIPIAVIYASLDHNGGIGYKGDLPWKNHKSSMRGDMYHFNKITKGEDPKGKNVVIMGRKTWDSLPNTRRPLKGRHNIVITRDRTKLSSVDDKIEIADSYKDAIDGAYVLNGCFGDINQIFIIGGSEIYEEAFRLRKNELYKIDEIYETTIYSDPKMESDTWMPFGFDTILSEEYNLVAKSMRFSNSCLLSSEGTYIDYEWRIYESNM